MTTWGSSTGFIGTLQQSKFNAVTHRHQTSENSGPNPPELLWLFQTPCCQRDIYRQAWLVRSQSKRCPRVVPWIMRVYVRGIWRSRGSQAVLTEDSVEKFQAPPHTAAWRGKRRCAMGLHRRRALSAALRLINIPFKPFLVTWWHHSTHKTLRRPAEGG